MEIGTTTTLPRGKRPQRPLDGKIGMPQRLPGQCGGEEILDPTGTQAPTPWFSIL
jgi:hypothetical protein